MTNLSLNGSIVIITISIVCISILLAIVILRYYWKQKLKNPVSRSEKSVLNNTGGIRAFGLCLTLIMAITLMSWTKTDKPKYDIVFDDSGWEDEFIEIPRTLVALPKRKPVPKRSENIIIEAVDDPQPIEEPKYIPEELPADVVISDTATEMPDIPIVPIVAPPKPKDDYIEEVWNRAEQMPRFPGCEDNEMSNDEKTVCAEKKMLKYVYDHLKYPAIARENGIQGRVVLQFVIDKKGDIVDIKVVKDVGAGCGDSALKVVKGMVKNAGLWTPGKQRHRNVKVRYTLPIDFRLK